MAECKAFTVYLNNEAYPRVKLGNVSFVACDKAPTCVGSMYNRQTFTVNGHTIVISGIVNSGEPGGYGYGVYFSIDNSADSCHFGTYYSPTTDSWQPSIYGGIYDMSEEFFAENGCELWLFEGTDAYDYTPDDGDWYSPGEDWESLGMNLVVKLYTKNGQWYYD